MSGKDDFLPIIKITEIPTGFRIDLYHTHAKIVSR